nr:hypothetical protein [Angustibacter aerolatus]
MQTDAAPATDQVDDVTAVEAAEPVDPADAMEAWAQVAHDEPGRDGEAVQRRDHHQGAR